MTIRKRLTLFYGGLLALVVIVFGIAALSMVRWAMIATIDDTLEESAHQIITNSDAYPIRGFDGTSRIEVVLAPLDIFRASGVYVQVWTILGRSEPEFATASQNLGDYRSPLDSVGLGSSTPYYNNVVINGTEWRVLTRPINVRKSLFGNVQVAASLEPVNQTTQRLLGIMAIGAGGALLGMAGLSLWFSHHALKPIDEITRAADGIANAKDLSIRLNWVGPQDELGRLVSVFNRMMSRLEHLFSVQQRFVADVSHELRTPLTAISGNLEIIKRYGMDGESLEAIESETQRMARLVDDLLLLARADYGGLSLDIHLLDLDTTVSEVFQKAQVLAKSSGVKLRLAAVEPLRVKGNPDRIKQLVFNLVNNALKFTPEGGEAWIALRADGDHALIEVGDNGIGIAPEDIDRIFDRFYQVDPSRATKEGFTGSGLGLSIAKWIAEAHGGKILVRSEKGQTVFTFVIPLIKTDAEHHHKTARIHLPFIGRAREPEA